MTTASLFFPISLGSKKTMQAQGEETTMLRTVALDDVRVFVAEEGGGVRVHLPDTPNEVTTLQGEDSRDRLGEWAAGMAGRLAFFSFHRGTVKCYVTVQLRYFVVVGLRRDGIELFMNTNPGDRRFLRVPLVIESLEERLEARRVMAAYVKFTEGSEALRGGGDTNAA